MSSAIQASANVFCPLMAHVLISALNKKIMIFVYHNPKGSEGRGNCHLESWISTGSYMPVTCVDTVLAFPVDFLHRSIVIFFGLIFWAHHHKVHKYCTLVQEPSSLWASPRQEVPVQGHHNCLKMLEQLSERLPAAGTGRGQQVSATHLVCNPSSQMRGLVIHFIELKQNFFLIGYFFFIYTPEYFIFLFSSRTLLFQERVVFLPATKPT